MLDPQSTTLPFWSLPLERAIEMLDASMRGISETEAKERLAIFGKNVLPRKSRLVPAVIFFNQLKSPLIFILLIAGGVTFSLEEYVETIAIGAAVLVNTFLGFWQEYKAESIFELLNTYVRTRARVRREDREREIDASELVPGDIIRVSQGDHIPADGRIIFATNVEVDESVLTGESLPVKKTLVSVPEGTSLADRTSMIWCGTTVTEGFADVLVTRTGQDTEFGKIALTLTEASTRDGTPLRHAISRLAVVTGIITLIVTIGIFGLGSFLGYDRLEIFLIAVSMAVSAVPEGLPIALTVILAVGARRIAEHKGIIRRLLAAETLGSTTVILTDKTGTLTQANMELEEILPSGHPSSSVELILESALLNTDVAVENPEDEPVEWKLFGRPLEIALVRGAAKRGVSVRRVLERHRVLDRLPFNSENKFSISMADRKGEVFVTLFGAPEILAERSVLSGEDRLQLFATINLLAGEGKRVLGVARKVLGPESRNVPDDASIEGLSFLGLVVFHDPLRPTVKDSIAKVARAGVRTIIVTGDHHGTAEFLGKELGLVTDSTTSISGSELAALSAEEFAARRDSISVYARVSPGQKVQILRSYQGTGEVVAMIGDGVNDAPALHEANIGVAVGTATDIAKSAADLVILDNNFDTLVAAIEEGRRILMNIRKVIVYLLSNVSAELFLIGGSLFAGLAMPLTAIQILFVNFFSDSFPALALAFERSIDPIGKKPRALHKNLIDKEMRILIFVIGLITSAALFALYFGLLKVGVEPSLVRTFIFASFATYTLFLSFSVRSLELSIFKYNPFSNLPLTLGVLFGFTLTLGAVYIPSLQPIFNTVSLPWEWLLGVVLVGVANVFGLEIGKRLYRTV